MQFTDFARVARNLLTPSNKIQRKVLNHKNLFTVSVAAVIFEYKLSIYLQVISLI